MPRNDTAILVLKSFLAGCLVGGGLLAGLILAKGWAAGLINSPYCGASAALTTGLFISLRHPGPAGRPWLLAGFMGLAVGLAPPLAGWYLAGQGGPAAGFTPGPFRAGQQAFLSLLSGLAGAYLGGRKSRLPAEPGSGGKRFNSAGREHPKRR